MNPSRLLAVLVLASSFAAAATADSKNPTVLVRMTPYSLQVDPKGPGDVTPLSCAKGHEKETVCSDAESLKANIRFSMAEWISIGGAAQDALKKRNAENHDGAPAASPLKTARVDDSYGGSWTVAFYDAKAAGDAARFHSLSFVDSVVYTLTPEYAGYEREAGGDRKIIRVLKVYPEASPEPRFRGLGNGLPF